MRNILQKLKSGGAEFLFLTTSLGASSAAVGLFAAAQAVAAPYPNRPITPPHLAGELLGPAMADLIAGRLDYAFATIAAAMRLSREISFVHLLRPG